MSVTQNYKTITLTGATCEAIASALRLAVQDAKEEVEMWAALSNREPCFTWAKRRLEEFQAAQKEFLESQK